MATTTQEAGIQPAGGLSHVCGDARAVLSEQKLIAEDLVNYKLKHSEKLMPAISSVMDSSGLDYGDLDVLAVTAGPVWVWRSPSSSSS